MAICGSFFKIGLHFAAKICKDDGVGRFRPHQGDSRLWTLDFWRRIFNGEERLL
jgi:hypothetical protein